MREILAPVVLVGLADSLNPATIALAVLMATGRSPVPRLLAFALGTGVVYFVGGLVLTLGPAALLHTVLNRAPGDRTHVAEIVVGLAAFAIAAWLWRRPAEQVARRLPRDVAPRRAFVLGAGITAVDLPTALPYFGAVGLIVAAGGGLASKVVLLVAFNLAYVLPLLLIALAVAILGERADRPLARVRAFVTAWSARLLAIITAASGCYLVAVGTTGLA